MNQPTLLIVALFITANKGNVLLSGVGDPFFGQKVRYHCPIYCVLNFYKVQTPIYTRKFYLYDRGNYQSLSDDLIQTGWNKIKRQ